MPLRRRWLVLVAAALPAVAHATTVRHLDLASLTHGSQEIVIGTVESARSYWNPQHTRIMTDVVVSVSRSLKGAETDRITLTQLGGEADGVRVTVPGAPVFREREETLLFVWRDARGRAQVNGLGQGKFDITTDPATGAKRVQRSAAGLAVGSLETLAAAPEGAPAPAFTLDELVREIQRELTQKGGR